MVQLGKGGGIQNDFRSSHVASKRRYGDGYESVFKQASSIISSMQGYINHELQRCMERKEIFAPLCNGKL